MPRETFSEQFIVTITSDKPIPDLVDHVAGRLWSLDHVTSATAEVMGTVDLRLGKVLADALKTGVPGIEVSELSGEELDRVARQLAFGIGDNMLAPVAENSVATGYMDVTTIDEGRTLVELPPAPFRFIQANADGSESVVELPRFSGYVEATANGNESIAEQFQRHFKD